MHEPIDPSLAPLFLGDKSQYDVNLKIQSALLVSWNPTTGANQVALRGSVFTNVSICGDNDSLTTGPVLVAQGATGPIILGSIFHPNS